MIFEQFLMNHLWFSKTVVCIMQNFSHQIFYFTTCFGKHGKNITRKVWSEGIFLISTLYMGTCDGASISD